MQCNDSYFYRYFGNISAIQITYESKSASNSGQHCVFIRREPSVLTFALYSFVIPSLGIFGLCANFINAIVFMRPKMTPSAFTYLSALSWLDCLSCLFITLTALSRSVFYRSIFWLAYDLQWQTALFGITTGAANLVLACASFDRLVYLWRGVPQTGTPNFCRRTIARRMVILVIFISCAVNLPYFFVFIVNKDGTFQTTQFYYSEYYKIHNWFSFILLAILPAIFLLIGNAAILIAFRRWTKQSKKCQMQCQSSSKMTQKRYQHQMKLTITILIVITLYLIGELPAHLTSRKSALNLLYSGDVTKVDFTLMEHLEIICMTLNAFQLSMNIMVYALINPSFMPEFFVCLRGVSDSCFRFCLCTPIAHVVRRCWHSDIDENDNESVVPRVSNNESSSPIETPPTARTKGTTTVDCGEIGKMHAKNHLKRSNSLGTFAYDNHGMIRDLSDENFFKLTKPKRHSVPLYCSV